MSVKDRSDKLVGTVYNSGKFGDYEIIYYGSVEDVLIRFHNTVYVTKSGMQRVRNGSLWKGEQLELRLSLIDHLLTKC